MEPYFNKGEDYFTEDGSCFFRILSANETRVAVKPFQKENDEWIEKQTFICSPEQLVNTIDYYNETADDIEDEEDFESV